MKNIEIGILENIQFEDEIKFLKQNPSNEFIAVGT